MPCQKKHQKPSPPVCMSPPSRRMLPHLAIQDIPHGRIICLPGSLSRSSSDSRLCNCEEVFCTQKVCPNLRNRQNAMPGHCHGQQLQMGTCVPRCKRMDGITIDNIPCCQELLRKLAQEAPAYHPNYPELDKRVNIQEPQNQTPDALPSTCAANVPEASPTCSIRLKPIKKTCAHPDPPKTTICCDLKECQESAKLLEETIPYSYTEQIEPNYENNPVDININEDDCSVASCARDVAPKDRSGWTPPMQSRDTFANYTRTQEPPMGAINSKPTSNIANKSGLKLFGKLVRKKDSANKKDEKRNKKEENKLKKKREKSGFLNETCSHTKCVAKRSCPCRFPPHFCEYYECTGKISGNCDCGQD